MIIKWHDGSNESTRNFFVANFRWQSPPNYPKEEIMKPLRVGIIGTGAIAQMAHIPNYLKNPEVDLVAIAEPDEGIRIRVQQELTEKTGHAVAAYADATELLREAQLDAVSIATPNMSHIDLAVAAVESGCHVLLEKPMALTRESADRLQAALEKGDRVVMVGQSHRYRNDVTALKRFVDAGALGTIYHAEARMIRRRGTPTGWFTDMEWAGGGPLMDIGVHALDLSWWLMGKPVPTRVSGHLTRAIGADHLDFIGRWTAKMPHNQDNAIFTTEDFATALIRFQGGATLNLTVSWAINGPQDDGLKVTIYGDKGGLTLDPAAIYSSDHHVLTDTLIPVGVGPMYQNEIDHFVECILDHQSPRSPVADGRTVAQMLVAIAESAERGEEVAVRR